MKFRKHRGGFAESLQTETNVESLSDVQKLFEDDFLGHEISELKCDYYGIDNRQNGYSDTFIITAILDNKRIVLGFSDRELK